MHKWLKRILLSLAVLLLLAIVGSALSWRLLHSAPSWYSPTMDPQRQAHAARQAEMKYVEARNWAAQRQAWESAVLHAARTGSTLPTTVPADSVSVRFTEEELNAVLGKWFAQMGLDQQLSSWIRQPAIALRNQRLVLAGHLTQIDAVASLQLDASLDSAGNLHVQPKRLAAGQLPIPQSFIASQKQKLLQLIQQRLPAWQRSARIDPSGAANSSALAATMGQLLTRLLSEQPGRPILFVPLLDSAKSLPVQLTDLKIDGDSILLTVKALDADQRSRLLTSKE